MKIIFKFWNQIQISANWWRVYSINQMSATMRNFLKKESNLQNSNLKKMSLILDRPSKWKTSKSFDLSELKDKSQVTSSESWLSKDKVFKVCLDQSVKLLRLQIIWSLPVHDQFLENLFSVWRKPLNDRALLWSKIELRNRKKEHT